MNRRELARYLARRIFAAPYGWKGDKVRRIAFRGGTEDKETDMGGFNEAALTACIAEALSEAETVTAVQEKSDG